MGRIFRVTCRNKECRYSVELREGPGFVLFRRVKDLEQDIKCGKVEVPKTIAALLETGHEVNCVATYLCPVCREWQVGYEPYVFEIVKASPYGTIREYKVHHISGIPKCEKCGAELSFVLNPRSSKTPCPKCGTENMKIGSFWYYD